MESRDRIILASASEARRQLLAAAGVAFVQHPADVVERDLANQHGGKSPRQLAGILAAAKAGNVSERESDALVIGADQTLELDGTLLFKPTDQAAARRQLQALAGKVHRLHSAFAIVRGSRTLRRATRTVRLAMRPLSDRDIDWYLGEVGAAALASVGGYQLEGMGVRLFERIEGDYFTVLGLPMLPLLNALRDLRAIE